MKLSEFDYNLPRELIAQEPNKPRDHSRLLVLDKTTKKSEHKHFYELLDYLEKGDVLVMNNSKVFPARLIGKRVETGGKVRPKLPESPNEKKFARKSAIAAFRSGVPGSGVGSTSGSGGGARLPSSNWASRASGIRTALGSTRSSVPDISAGNSGISASKSVWSFSAISSISPSS